MKIFGLTITTKSLGVNSEIDKVVAALKATDIGATIAADIKAVEDPTKSGADKFAQVVANTAPLVIKYAASGGYMAVVKDVEDITRQLVQSVYNDVQSVTVGKIISALKKALGL